MFEMRCKCGHLLFKAFSYPERLELDCRACRGRITTENGKVTKIITRDELKRLKKKQ